jgi:hypothetical protein
VLRDLIDDSVARREGKGPAKTESVQVNTSMYLAPQAAFQVSSFLRPYLEWQTHKRALPNATILYSLYRGGLLAPDASPTEQRSMALKYCGFIPVSPDGVGYAYEHRTDEVVNRRHGSFRQPRLSSEMDEQSPVSRLLTQFRTLRADLRFREDGVHSVLRLQRQAAKGQR